MLLCIVATVVVDARKKPPKPVLINKCYFCHHRLSVIIIAIVFINYHPDFQKPQKFEEERDVVAKKKTFTCKYLLVYKVLISFTIINIINCKYMLILLALISNKIFSTTRF